MSRNTETIEPAPTDQSEPTTGADVLIVIPTLNEEAHIDDVIASLQVDRRCREALIVVSDGGSSDRTAAIVEGVASTDPRVRVLTTVQRLSTSAAINRAVECFGNERTWLVRLDAHAGYPKDYASRLVIKAIEMGATSVVTPMFTCGSTCFQRAVAAAQNSFLGTGGSAHRLLNRGGWVEHGHHALIDLKWFRQLGGYDDKLKFNEDAEFDRRLIKSGGRIWLADDLVITYFPRGDGIALFRQYVKHGRGRAHTFARHGGRRGRHYILASIAPIVILGFFSSLYWPLMLPVSGWVITCLSYGLILGIKQKDICASGSGFAAMVMQLAWSLGHWREIISIRAGRALRLFRSAAGAGVDPRESAP
jgi:succinoglycan biosynthesis protein ExoA